MKKLLMVLIVLLGVFTLASCGNENEQDDNVLVVGMEAAYQPFNWTETVKTDSNVQIANLNDSYAAGYDVEIAKRIAESLGMTLEIRALEWEALIQNLKGNQIDLIIAGMSDTPERRESIDFTDGYYSSREVLVMRKDSTFASATKMSDLTGAKVSGQLGTIFADLVSQTVEQGAIAGNNQSTVGAIINDIMHGVTDATIVELPAAEGIVSTQSDLTIVQLTEDPNTEINEDFVVSPSDVTVNIGIRQGYDKKDAINLALSQISEDTRQELMKAAVTAYASLEM